MRLGQEDQRVRAAQANASMSVHQVAGEGAIR
jgi:hypothetical protein